MKKVGLDTNFFMAIFLQEAEKLDGPRHQSTILMNTSNLTNQYDSGKRFTFAHELCHILYDRTYGMKLAMASGRLAHRDLERN